MFDHIAGVFRLNVNTFEEIEHDESATGQAAIVVAFVALLNGLGAGFLADPARGGFISAFLSTIVWVFAGWLIWAVVSYFVGTTFFGGQATVGEMLRVIGFAHAPLILGIIPCIGPLVGSLWALVAGFIAMRQGLDLDDLRTGLTVIIGFIPVFLGRILFSFLFGGINIFG